MSSAGAQRKAACYPEIPSILTWQQWTKLQILPMALLPGGVPCCTWYRECEASIGQSLRCQRWSSHKAQERVRKQQTASFVSAAFLGFVLATLAEGKAALEGPALGFASGFLPCKNHWGAKGMYLACPSVSFYKLPAEPFKGGGRFLVLLKHTLLFTQGMWTGWPGLVPLLMRLRLLLFGFDFFEGSQQ